ncbi:MAG: citrate (Si)-synthase [Gammaproteobacteria bacterium]|jgi:citrate synthase|nr:citrate (Si)-synthase [Gammaproteobacteria bacterium]
MSESALEAPRVHRGLKDVYFDRSSVSSIDGRAGELRYRGYSIHDLAENATFEEVCGLLLFGELPSRRRLSEIDAELKASRNIPAAVYALIASLKNAHPMEVLRTAVSALGALCPEPNATSTSPLLEQGLRLTAQVPTIITTHYRLRQGLDPIEPSRKLAHGANFLYMLHGREPTAEAARVMDVDLVLHAEHGSNASSFAARVVAGTGANLHAALTAAIGALSGPAHGGAAEDVLKMVREIGEPANAAAWVKAKRAKREPIMGFGHRVYRATDPRARHLSDRAAQLSREYGQPQWYAVLEAVVEAMQPYSRLGVNVNVDFYAGVIYHLLGISQEFFVPIFAMGRVPGWVIQVREQVENNILIRPLTVYDGPPARDFVPLDLRG